MSKSSYTNSEIIDAIKSNKADKVLLHLYKNLQPKISRWIATNSGSKEEAQDIFQDSILVFYSYVLNDKFDANASVEAFVFRIAKNKWINYVKKEGKKTSIKGDIAINEKARTFEKTSNQELINGLLEQLGAVCKEILTYTIFYKISMEDVCARMNYNNPNTAKTKNYKCKQRLKNLINENPRIKQQLSNAR
ncbi:MAG: sigma-70 family RNA polymerase sigma factor [Flavobacteriales bacterium]